MSDAPKLRQGVPAFGGQFQTMPKIENPWRKSIRSTFRPSDTGNGKLEPAAEWNKAKFHPARGIAQAYASEPLSLRQPT
jgi:hypothetical protein